jgi:hypothetical protein
MSLDQFSDRDERLGNILAACLEAAEAGCAADRRELLDRHPEFAAELTDFFASCDRVPGLAPHLASSAAPDAGDERDRPAFNRSWWDGNSGRSCGNGSWRICCP